MNISATSALVLNWTTKDIYSSRNAQDYLTGLDLSSADPIFKTFNDEENFIYTQVMSNRKFFVRKQVMNFLEQCRGENQTGQVIILAAGIDPLSVEIASLYPSCVVFDIDKYSMNEKEKYLHSLCENIHFIECDVTDLELVNKKLIVSGWDKDGHSMLVLEGITYYLREDDLRSMLKFFSPVVSKFVCDFGVLSEYVDERNRKYGVKIYEKIEETIRYSPMKRYEPDHYMRLINECGFMNCRRFTMRDIQMERTGESSMFNSKEPAWVSLVCN